MSKLKLLLHVEKEDTLTLHPDKAECLSLNPEKPMFLRFGVGQYPVRISLDAELDVHAAALSENLMRRLNIPLTCRYELVNRDDVLWLGPFISFLVSHQTREIDQHIRTLTDYLSHYEDIGGAVLAFALEGIDRSAGTIQGYMYNPETKEWDRGTYSYPASIFIRGHVASKFWCRHFQSVLGRGAVFNDFYLDKWEMHKLLTTSAELKTSLPATALYKRPSDVIDFLSTFPTVYIKPIHGTMGISILKGTMTPKGLEVSYQHKGQQERLLFHHSDEAKAFFEQRLESGTYIIQQGISLRASRRQLIDFRLIVVKNRDGQWVYMGMVARHGVKDSIVSNISAGGYAERGEMCLQRILGLKKRPIFKLTRKMAALALDIAHFLDASGLHCGNMGVDIGLDQDNKLWIIEIQHHSPAHSIAVDANDTDLYLRTLQNNMLYMKRLAGFYGKEK